MNRPVLSTAVAAPFADADADAAALEVLLIEDDLVDEMATLRTVAAQRLPYRVQLARSLAQARTALAARRFDVILADYRLPDGSSFELMDLFADQLVIFITGDWNAEAAAQALHLGVHDYLIKDGGGTYLQLLHYRVQTALRQRRLAAQLRESEARLQAILDHAPAAISVRDLQGRLVLSNRRHAAGPQLAEDASEGAPLQEPVECEEVQTGADGSQRTLLTVRFPMTDLQGCTQAIGAISVDITARKQAELKISQLAFHDTLTGLPNRRMLVDRLQQACATSARHGSHGAVFFIDLDHFKALNDSLGHDHGDLLLQTVASRLLNSVRGEDTVARIGGDEFVVVTVGLDATERTAATQAAVVGEKILAAVTPPCQLGTHTHSVTPSIGVSLFHGREATVDAVLKRADLAMYQAKAAGRGTVRFFDPVMQRTLDHRQALEAELRRAVGAGELRMHFQPQVDERRGVVGAEVLLRWQHPRRGLLLPDQFLALAEQTGLIVPIGDWVIEQACRQLRAWSAPGPGQGLHLAVNVSARQFRHDHFVEGVLQALRRHGSDPSRLRLELREDVVHDHTERTLGRMHTLKDVGVGFVMEDFGISLSSLANLKRLPLDQIKIARSLMTQLTSNPHDAAVVRTIVGIAAGMGFGASACGVETEPQFALLRELGCSLWQGHLFGAALPLAAFEDLLGTAACTARSAPFHS